MNKSLNNSIQKLNQLRYKIDVLEKEVILKIYSLCEFEASLTYCEGDGYLILDLDNANTSVLSCLDEITTDNKLSRDDFDNNGV